MARAGPSSWASAAAVLIGWLLSGCAGAGPDALGTPTPGGGAPSFQAVQSQIFNQSCALGGCHNLSGAGSLTLLEGQAYQQLVGVTPANDAARRAGLLRVTPGDPDRSLLFIKISQDPPPLGEGSQMPLSGSPLSPAQIEMVRQWIAAGALDAAGVTPTPTPTPTPTISPGA